MSQNTFADLGASASTVSALKARGITEPFAIQELVLPDAIAGRDVLAKSRTGSGKTLAFAIPIVQMLDRSAQKPAALILVPTRELAAQVTAEFAGIAEANGLKVSSVYGGVGMGDQVRKATRSHIIVATPGRLEDLASRRLLKLDQVRILVLDEADRMLDMGFQPQVDIIVRRIPKTRQTMFFSATLEGVVGRLASRYTTSPAIHEVASAMSTVDSVDHTFVKVESGDKLTALIDLLNQKRELALVFVRTKRGVDRLASKLRAHGIAAAPIHGDMTQQARDRALKSFRSGSITALIATDVAARGLDVDDISHVINYDPPEDHTAYVHRVGRTARAGRSGSGVTLVTPEQQKEVGRVAVRLKLNTEFEKDGLKMPPPTLAFSSRNRRPSRGSRRPLSRTSR